MYWGILKTYQSHKLWKCTQKQPVHHTFTWYVTCSALLIANKMVFCFVLFFFFQFILSVDRRKLNESLLTGMYIISLKFLFVFNFKLIFITEILRHLAFHFLSYSPTIWKLYFPSCLQCLCAVFCTPLHPLLIFSSFSECYFPHNSSVFFS